MMNLSGQVRKASLFIVGHQLCRGKHPSYTSSIREWSLLAMMNLSGQVRKASLFIVGHQLCRGKHPSYNSSIWEWSYWQ